jgi:predicted PurR-regulated permease PerM
VGADRALVDRARIRVARRLARRLVPRVRRRPLRLVGRREHPLLTLVALLGGLEVMGVAGLLIGPIVMALFVAALRIWEHEHAR